MYFNQKKANWLSQIPGVIKQYNNTIHSWIKMTPNRATRKTTEKVVFLNLHDKREKTETSISIRTIK